MSKYFDLIEQHKQHLEEFIQQAVENDSYEEADRYLTAQKKLDGLF